MAIIEGPESASSNADPNLTTGWALKVPTNPALNLADLMVQGHSVAQLEDGAVFYPLDYAKAVKVSGQLYGEDGQLQVTTVTQAQHLALRVLEQYQGTLLLQTPNGEQWYVAWTGPRQRSADAMAVKNRQLSYVDVGP